MTRKAVGCLVSLVAAVALGLGVSPASADGCYPPPCPASGAATVGAVGGAGTQIPEVLPAPEHATRGPVPLVAGGLLLVAATTTALCVTRRNELVMRGASVRRPIAAPQPPVLEAEKSVA